MLTAVMAALVGAVFAGAFRVCIDIIDRLRHRQSVLKAIASEVAILCQMIDMQYSPAHFRQTATRVDAGEKAWLPVDLTQNYFAVFDALSRELGSLNSREAASIVRFYTLCKVVVDTARLDSPYRGPAQNLRFAANIAEEALRVGQQVVAFPKDKLLHT